MTEVDAEQMPARRKTAGLAWLAITMLLTGGSGFAIGTSGLVPLPFGAGIDDNASPNADRTMAVSTPLPLFHPLPEIVIPIGNTGASRYLRAKLHLEIEPSAVELLRRTEPRIVDTLNIFLRAVDERDLSSIRAMENLRAEMLRRVRLVTGADAVHAVLIGEFLLR